MGALLKRAIAILLISTLMIGAVSCGFVPSDEPDEPEGDTTVSVAVQCDGGVTADTRRARPCPNSKPSCHTAGRLR